MPGFISFSHIFADHDHHICKHYAEKHFHSKDLDCDLYKFHSSPALVISFNEYPEFSVQPKEKIQLSHYFFFPDFESLPYDLRGPPSLLS